MRQRRIKRDMATDGVKNDIKKGVVKFWLRVRSKLIKRKRSVRWGDYKILVVSTPKDRKGVVKTKC